MIQPNGGKDNPKRASAPAPTRSPQRAGRARGGERSPNYWRDDRGHADQIEIIVINDATARMAALQSGQVNMINRVEPKIVDLIKRAPGVTIQNVAARATTSSSPIATRRRSTTTTCAWR
jgi:peptide/nickel transport system substrate-binding protein